MLTRKRVLLVEDHPDTSELIRHELSFGGYDVLIAEDGREAVSASLLLPDLIIMDMRLPRMNGFEATKRIRENPKTATIPILAATALNGPGDRERCLAAGCDDYIAKPFTHKELLEMLSKLLEKTAAAATSSAAATADSAPTGK
ncbi:MAG TPA: response regulator [Candidatus Binatia bacterium]|jgi:two-component system cell cycle response regulator DivK|nr:response regulator [Candidatus Binatia bacterium]